MTAVFREGIVVEIVEERGPLLRMRVDIEGDDIDACGYQGMLGPIAAGNHVVVNTTGIDLGLGTGGAGFVLWNLDGPGPPEDLDGHIMKLRYTPWQIAVLAAEAPESAHHEELAHVRSIGGMPVVACGLHSHIAPAAAGLKAGAPDAVIGFLMTDGGALPIAWSNLVASCKDTGLIDLTSTAGHAFGGDLEAVNIFSGLAGLRVAAGCDAVIVAPGPGVVGTGTVLGFSAMEQGQVLDAAGALGGVPIACLRLSFADPRRRHRGVSHQSLTALALAARDRCTIAVPELDAEPASEIRSQLAHAGLLERHDILFADGAPGLALLAERGVWPHSMGRSIRETPEVFLAAAAAGAIAAERLAGR